MTTEQIVALILFVATYILLFVFQNYRAYIAGIAAVIFVIAGFLPFRLLSSTINWNVLMMIGGTMGTVFFFIESKVPALLADLLIKKMPNVKCLIIALSLFAGIVSAFIDNVATVLMIAPVALTICKKLNISPVPSLISIAVSSNLQGAATLVGDTTSIMLAGAADMNFMDFFIFKGRMGMFFVVEISAILTVFIMMWLFRKDTQKVDIQSETKVEEYVSTIALVGTVLLLIVASFFEGFAIVVNGMDITNGVICVGVFLLLFVYMMIKNKGVYEGESLAKRTLKEIDFFTLLLLAGLFVIVGGVKNIGLIDIIGQLFLKLGGGNLFWIYTIIVWASVIFSAFIDNIPYVATMLPVTTVIATHLGVEPYILYFGLLTGATLGGNITPIGASANITAIGILRKEGYEVKNSDFFRIGIPFTLTAVIAGYVMVWLIWA